MSETKTKRKRAAKPQAQARQYIASVPNSSYNGVTCGVRFYDGQALIAPHTLNPYLDWTIDQIVEKMRVDFGYEVTEVTL